MALLLLVSASLAAGFPERPFFQEHLDHVRRLVRELSHGDHTGRPAAAFSSSLAAVTKGRGLQDSPFNGGGGPPGHHCRRPFRVVGRHEGCTPESDGLQQYMCKAPLRCIRNRCELVEEGDPCADHESCGGGSSNLDLVCVRGKCAHLVEAGDKCEGPEDCFSQRCEKGVCTGLEEGAACSYGAPNSTFRGAVSFQNPCGKDLYCALRGSKDGAQDAKCAAASGLGDVCFSYALPMDMESRLEDPRWFLSAYASAVYVGCRPGLVCEIQAPVMEDSEGRGVMAFSGLCQRLMSSPQGAKCSSDLGCEPPYACIDGTCASHPPACGIEATPLPELGGDPSEDMASRADMLHRCANNERCNCPGGLGQCEAIHQVCHAEEMALVGCMERHGCPWVDFGQTQCAEDNCRDEDIAFECCKYNDAQHEAQDTHFAANVDWEAMSKVYKVNNFRDMCTHIVGGAVHGLNRGERVVLENNGIGDITMNDDGGFQFQKPVTHLGAYNVTITHDSTRGGCRVEAGAGNATDDVYDVKVVCNRGGSRRGSGKGGHGGAIAAAVLVPFFVLCACGGLVFVALRRGGGDAREGFASLAADARNIQSSLPPLQIPFASARQPLSQDGAAQNAGDWVDSIPQAQIVDAQTGQPVVQATTVA